MRRRALASYDADRGVPLPAYYRVVLQRRFLDLGRRQRLQSNADLDAALTGGTQRAERSEQLRLEVHDTLTCLLGDDSLSPKKREAFRLFHLEGWQPAQLSLHFGKDRATVRRWVREAEGRFKHLWLAGETAA